MSWVGIYKDYCGYCEFTCQFDDQFDKPNSFLPDKYTGMIGQGKLTTCLQFIWGVKYKSGIQVNYILHTKE